MIKVIADFKAGEITADGHAGDDYGHDLVCAAVSTLIQTMEQMAQEFDCFGSHTFEIRSGHSEFNWTAKEGQENLSAMCIASILCGFKWLTTEYPDRVSIDIT